MIAPVSVINVITWIGIPGVTYELPIVDITSPAINAIKNAVKILEKNRVVCFDLGDIVDYRLLNLRDRDSQNRPKYN